MPPGPACVARLQVDRPTGALWRPTAPIPATTPAQWHHAPRPADSAHWTTPQLQQSLAQLRALLGVAGPIITVAAPRLEVIQARVGNTVHLVPVAEVLYFEVATGTCGWSPPAAST